MSSSPQRSNLPGTSEQSDTSNSQISKLERLESLVEIGKTLGSSLNLTEIIQSVRLQLGKTFNVENFYIAIYNQKRDCYYFALQVEHGIQLERRTYSADRGVTGYILRTKKSLIFHTSEEMSLFCREQNVQIKGELAQSWMGIPLMAGDKVMGVMAIQSYDEEIHYNHDDLDYFLTIGYQIAVAIQRARYYQASLDKIQRLSVLLEVSSSLATNLDLETLARTVYKEVGRLFEADNFYIATYEQGEETWELLLLVEEGAKEGRERHSIYKGLTGYIIRKGKALLFNSPEELKKFTDEHGVKVIGRPPLSWMGLPLIVHETLVGVMAIQNYEEENCYDQTDMELFSTIAPIVASSIQNAQLFQKVASQNKALDEANKELKNTQLKLVQSQKLEAIGQLAAGIAHEINTPIQFIGDNTGFFQESYETLKDVLQQSFQIIMENDTVPESEKEQLNRIKDDADIEYILEEIPDSIAATLDGVKRVSAIVKGLKAFSHPDTEDKVSVNIHELIQNTAIICRNEWKDHVDILYDFDEDSSLVPCFPGDINQVIMNMIINAAHAIEKKFNGVAEKGELKISTYIENTNVVLLFSDNGCGIDENILPNIFDPFYTTKEVGKGSGQGLSISNNIIVKKHSGKIEVESSKDVGTTFRVILPLS